MDFDPATAVLWVAASGLFALALRRGRESVNQALKAYGRLLLFVATRLPLALILAGFLAVIMPAEVVVGLIGGESGFGGIVVASFVGGLVPSGPFVSFPIAYTLLKSGAGLPQLVAFLSGWGVFAFHRVLIYEWPMMGLRFTAVRLTASLLLPPLSGLAAQVLFALV